VPRLPDLERAQLARVLLARSQATRTAPATLMETMPAMATSARLLTSDQVRMEQEGKADITLVSTCASKQAPVTARGVAARSGRLWGLLSAPELAVAAPPRMPAQVADVDPVLSSPIAAATAEVAAAAVEVRTAPLPEELSTQASTSSVAAPAPSPELDELKVRLEQAMRRVDMLEARLESQEQRQASHEQETERKVCAPSAHDPEDDDILSGRHQPSPAVGTLGGLAAVMTAAAQSPSPAMWAPLHLSQPFSFEEFRRAQSPKLQAERMRMIMPPHHFPVWPLPKK